MLWFLVCCKFFLLLSLIQLRCDHSWFCWWISRFDSVIEICKVTWVVFAQFQRVSALNLYGKYDKGNADKGFTRSHLEMSHFFDMFFVLCHHSWTDGFTFSEWIVKLHEKTLNKSKNGIGWGEQVICAYQKNHLNARSQENTSGIERNKLQASERAREKKRWQTNICKRTYSQYECAGCVLVLVHGIYVYYAGA